MSYHVGRAGRRLGVFSLEEIRAKLADGELLSDDLGWTEGMTDWRALGDIALAEPPPPAPPSPPAPANDAPSPGVAVPPAEPDGRPSASSRTISAGSAKHRGRPRRRSKPDNHLVGAILVTLFCCLPFGIAAIVYASQVDGKYQSGDHAGAREAAHKAKNFIWISFGSGVVIGFAYAALALAGGVMGG